MNMNFRKMGSDNTIFLYTDKEGEHQQVNVNIREFLDAMESKVMITIFAEFSASQTSDSVQTRIPSGGTLRLGKSRERD